MFDWNDQELANVIWDDSGENEDHIVPYPDEKPSGPYGEHSKVSDQYAANVTEKTTHVSITDSLLRSNIHRTVSTDGFGSLPDLSPSNATKLDLEDTDEKAQVDNGGTQVFDNDPEDKDANNFVDYGWAHVGSFDDLDRLLSNNDLVYGDVNISNSEALWSSPRDVIDSPNLQLRSDSHGKTNDHLCHSSTSLANLEYGGGKNEKFPKEKFSQSASEIIGRTPTPLVCSIRDANVAIPDKIATEKMGEQSQKMEGQKRNQGKEFEGRYRQHIKYSQQTESSTYNQFIQPLPHSLGYNNLMENKHHSSEEYQQVPSGSSSYVSDHKTMPTSMMMTSQEKVEKLRRRQQMRALLAIRKQQQEFRHQQVSSNNYLNLGKYLNESRQMQFTREGNAEIDGSLTTLTSIDSDNKSTLEDTILHQLQNVISKLDIEIRVCIRDSLFRLAHSTLRRQSDGSRDEASVIMEERLTSTKSSARTPYGETKTNPIDRAVAHLLFHTPPGEFLHSPLSCKQTRTSSTNLPTGFLNESYEDDRLSCLVEQENKETAGGSGVESEASSRRAPLL